MTKTNASLLSIAERSTAGNTSPARIPSTSIQPSLP